MMNGKGKVLKRKCHIDNVETTVLHKAPKSI